MTMKTIAQPAHPFNKAAHRDAQLAKHATQAKAQAEDAASFEQGTFDDGISAHEDWSRNDTRTSAPRYEEGVQLLHQLTYGARLRPHRA
jgi:hypothetical protein